MSSAATVIQFTIRQDGEDTLVRTRTHDYRNLMVLLNNHCYLENFGECGGMGRCATCVVKLSGKAPELASRHRNEQATLEKSGIADPAMRLACQIPVTPALNEELIEIINDAC